MLKNNMNPFKVMIISCWVLLGLAVICKLCGADWFIASSDNKNFVKTCNYIDDHVIIQSVIYTIINIFSCSIYYMAILKEDKLTTKSLKWFIPLLVYSILKGIFQDYAVILFFILDIFMMVLLPIIIKKKIWLFAIIGFILVTVFQLISMLLKMNHYDMFDDNTLVDIILNIDYYIMLVLFYLYRINKTKKKEDENNG